MALHYAIARAALDNTESRADAYYATKICHRKYINGVPPDPNKPVEAQMLQATAGNPDAYYAYRQAELAIMFPAEDQGPPATVTSIDPTSAAIGSPQLTLHVYGTDFTDGHTILFNNGVEATTFVSDTELTTTVRPATASVEGAFPVAVQGPGGLISNAVDFTFTAEETP